MLRNYFIAITGFTVTMWFSETSTGGALRKTGMQK